MPRSKKSVRFPVDLTTAICHMPTDKAGELFKAILNYAQSGDEPNFANDTCLQIAWGFVRAEIDADSKKYMKLTQQRTRKD